MALTIMMMIIMIIMIVIIIKHRIAQPDDNKYGIAQPDGLRENRAARRGGPRGDSCCAPLEVEAHWFRACTSDADS